MKIKRISLMAAVIAAFLFTPSCMPEPRGKILEVKNCGNLNCVIFIENGDTFGLDFLTHEELDSLQKALSR